VLHHVINVPVTKPTAEGPH